MKRKLYRSTREIWEAEEIKVVRRRRRRIQKKSSRTGESPDVPVRTSLVGLSLSGGGIRSGLLNLGVLQELSQLGILRMVDILSTVSGGGYIGGCLSALLSIKDPGEAGCLSGKDIFDFCPTQQPLFSTDWERFPFRQKKDPKLPDEFEQCCTQHEKIRRTQWNIRFSSDTEMKHLRNHSNYLLPGGSHAFEALRAAGALSLHFLAPFLWFTSFVALITVGFMLYVAWLFNSTGVAVNLFPYSWEAVKGFYQGCIRDFFVTFDAWRMNCFALGISAVIISSLVFYKGFWKEKYEEVHFVGLSFWAFFAVSALVSILMMTCDALWFHPGHGPYFLLDFFFFSLCSLAVTFLVYGARSIHDTFGSINERSCLHVVAGSQVLLLGIGFLIAVLPLVIKMTPGVILPGIQAALALGIRYMLGSLSSETGRAGGISKEMLARIKQAAFSLAVYLFVLFFVLIMGQVADKILWDGAWLEKNALEFHLSSPHLLMPAVAALVFFGLPLLNFNRLSNHYLYRDRLSEAFLQTSAGRRLLAMLNVTCQAANCIIRKTTGIRLSQLHGTREGCGLGELRGADNVAAMGPYHIINATLNLTSEHNLKGLKRKTEPFTFSRLFTGSEATGFVRTEDCYSSTTLARAMTISGAAVAPIMGRMTSRLSSFACTILGVRLGCWVVNPVFLATGRRKDDRIRYWLKPLFRELTGSSSSSGPYLYISDGGHCGDNLGIIPLLKRRAKFVIASDAECDPDFSFQSLNSSLRQIYVDEGVKIDLKDAWRQFVPDDKGFTKSHYLVGRILYPDRPWQASWLLVLKSSLTGDEMAPIINYKRSSPDFPHETTANQFFTEEQFESYRALGRHLAQEALEEPAQILESDKTASVWSRLDEFCRALAGEESGKHRWDDPLAAMWDTEQVDFSSWSSFRRAVQQLYEATEQYQTKDVLIHNLGQLEKWLAANEGMLDREPLLNFPVPRDLSQFCCLQERLSRSYPDTFQPVPCPVLDCAT